MRELSRGPMRPWFPWRRPRLDARARLLCLPHAGGAALSYRDWGASRDMETCALELPGRGTRWREEPVRNMHELLDRLLPVIMSFDDLPLVVFGHSMGGAIGFLLAQRMIAEGLPAPALVVVSGARANLRPTRLRSQLPDRELIELLKDLGGTRAELLNSEEIMQLSLPLVRADFELLESAPSDPDMAIDSPLAAFGGTDDLSAAPETLREWRSRAQGWFSTSTFSGGHFYVHEARSAVEAQITGLLNELTCRHAAALSA